MPLPHREKLRTLALVWGAMLGPIGFKRLLNHFGSTRDILEAEVDALRNPILRLSREQVALIPTLAERLEDFERELEDLWRDGITVVCWWEEGYPALLAGLRDAPPVICMAGRILPQDEPAIAIVGTRSPSAEGLAMSRRLAAAFAQTGTTVVSGLARGCDGAAHRGALEVGGRTIAVLGSGIRVIHPREHLDLARSISQHGAVISELRPSARPTVAHFMARNRLQSALARAVLVVESREQGGAMETARRAWEQGREVYAVQWPSHTEGALGPALLLRQGARPVSSPEEVPRIRLELLDHVARMGRRKQAEGGQMSLF